MSAFKGNPEDICSDRVLPTLTRGGNQSLHLGWVVAARVAVCSPVNTIAVFPGIILYGRAAIVGAGRYILVQPGKAEAAFAVIDEYQGLGIGAGCSMIWLWWFPPARWLAEPTRPGCSATETALQLK